MTLHGLYQLVNLVLYTTVHFGQSQTLGRMMFMCMDQMTKLKVLRWLAVHVYITTRAKLMVLRWLAVHVYITTRAKLMVLRWLAVHVYITTRAKLIVLRWL